MHSRIAGFASLVLMMLGPAGPAASDIERRAASDFHLCAAIEGAVAPGEAHAVPLSREAVAALKKGGELRLFDEAGGEIPSLVYTADSRSEVIDRPVAIYNRAWEARGRQTLAVELEDRKPQPVNEFVFDIKEKDYNLRVRVEGSPDGDQWRILGDGLHLIRHTVEKEKIRYVHNVLRVPTARFRHYRFTLEPMIALEADQEPLEIEKVDVRQVAKRGSSLTVPVGLEAFEDPQDSDARHDFWTLDMGREDLGVDHLDLTIPAEDYARSASLWEWSEERGRRTRRLTSTVVFHYGDDVHTELSGFSTDVAKLVLMIDQGDDEPVPVSAVRAYRPQQQLRFLVPRAASPPLALYFDPDEPREPRYDLARRLREREIESFTALAHGSLEPNPVYSPPPQPRSERIPYLLFALVIPLVGGLGWYVARTIQRGIPD